MSTLRHPVHPALAGLVTTISGFDLSMPADAVHFGSPSPSATVLICLDAPFDVGWLGESHARYETLVTGLHTRPSLVRTHGRQFGIQLGLTPCGVRRLLGLPVGELHHLLLTFNDAPLLPAGTLHRLPEMLWHHRFQVIEAELLSRAADSTATARPEVDEAWNLLTATAGHYGVADLARHLGWSRRHLSTHFTAELGIGLKQAGRLHRFTASRRLVQQGASINDVAHHCGYADQAHLTREWREFGGQTPSQWQDFPILQDLATPAPQGSSV